MNSAASAASTRTLPPVELLLAKTVDDVLAGGLPPELGREEQDHQGGEKDRPEVDRGLDDACATHPETRTRPRRGGRFGPVGGMTDAVNAT